MRTPISRRARARPVVHTSPFTPSASTKDPIVVAANAQGHTMLRLTRRPHRSSPSSRAARARVDGGTIFTTEGRLMRGAGAHLIKQFVPVQGPVAHPARSWRRPEAALVSEARRGRADGATETLIGTAEEGALGRRARGRRVLAARRLAPAGAARAGGASLDGATWQPRRPAPADRRATGWREEDEASLLAIAAGLAKWHDKNQFCGVSGGRTVPEARRQGRVRSCAESGERLRPRVDPSVIMLVVDGDRCRSAAKRSGPPGGTRRWRASSSLASRWRSASCARYTRRRASA